MAEASPGQIETDTNFLVGLSPSLDGGHQVATNVCQLLYQALLDVNLTFQTAINNNFDVKITNIDFKHSTEDNFVTAKFKLESKDQTEIFRTLLADDSLSKVFDSSEIHLNFDSDFEKNIKIIAFALDGTERPVGARERCQESTASSSFSVSPRLHETEQKKTKVMVRVFVPYPDEQTLDVDVIWRGKPIRARQIHKTGIWSAEICVIDKSVAFQIKVIRNEYIHLGTSFKPVKEVSNLIVHTNKNIHHIVFTWKLKEKDIYMTYENAFIAFVANILNHEVYEDLMWAIRQIESMTSTEFGISISKIGWKKKKKIIADIIRKLSNGLDEYNLYAFCIILCEFLSVQVKNSTLDLTETRTAAKAISLLSTMSSEYEIPDYMNKISVSLLQLYTTSYGKRACIIGFIDRTVHVLEENLLCDILQNSIEKAENYMPVYVPSSNLKVDRVLLKICANSKYILIQNILWNLLPYCKLEEYVLSSKTVLKIIENVQEHRLLTEICTKKCAQHFLKLSKEENLKSVLQCWQIIEPLNDSSPDVLQPLLEKVIIEICNARTKNEPLDSVSEILLQNVVLESQIFICPEQKMALLKALAHTNFGHCMVNLLANAKFQSLSDDFYQDTVTKWMTNTLQMYQEIPLTDGRVVRAYQIVDTTMKLPPVQKNKNLQLAINELLLNTIIEQIDFKDLMTNISEIETHEGLRKLFQQHVSRFLHRRQSQNTLASVIHDICEYKQETVQSG